MFGIGLPEFILIMALALIVVGPDKLPGLAKTVAKQILELKKAANELKDSLQDEIAEEKESFKELTGSLDDIDVSLTDSAPADKTPEHSPPHAAGEDEAMDQVRPDIEQEEAATAHESAYSAPSRPDEPSSKV